MSLNQMFRVEGMDALAISEGGAAISSSKPTLDLDPEYYLGTTGARLLDASLKQGFQLGSDPGIGTQDFSFEWFGTRNSDSSYHRVLGISGRLFIGFPDNATHLNILMENLPYIQPVHNISDLTQWHHFLITFDRDGLLSAYVDGELQGTSDISSGGTAITGDTFIGSSSLGGNCYDGALSRIRLYVGHVLSAAEAVELYARGQGQSYAQLSAAIKAKVTHAWNCFEASDGTSHVPLYDAAPAGNDASEVGGELLTDGGLENWTTSTDLTSWTEVVSGTSTVNQETSDIHGGSNACRFDVDASNSYAYISQLVMVAGNAYDFSVWAKTNVDSSSFKFNGDHPSRGHTLTTSWAQYSNDALVATGPEFLINRSDAASASLYIDDVSVTSPYIPSVAGPNPAVANDFEGNNNGVLEFSDVISCWVTDIPDGSYGIVCRNSIT